MSIDMGLPRSVPAHLVSGTAATAIVTGAINLEKVNRGGLEAKAAFRKTAKEALQGGVAVGAGVAMANMLGNDRTCWWNVALTVVAAGVAVYGLERTLGAKES